MTSTEQPRRVVDLETLAGLIADGLASPTYAVDGAVTGNTGDAFLTFDTRTTESHVDEGEVTITATVDHVSDGEDPVEVDVVEVLEIVVRRVTR